MKREIIAEFAVDLIVAALESDKVSLVDCYQVANVDSALIYKWIREAKQPPLMRDHDRVQKQRLLRAVNAWKQRRKDEQGKRVYTPDDDDFYPLSKSSAKYVTDLSTRYELCMPKG